MSLETVVDNASAVALVEPLESASRWEDNKIVTYTHVRVVETVAGKALVDPWIRTLGGTVGDIVQVAEGEPDLRSRSLVFLRNEGSALVVVGRAQGQYLAASDHGSLVLHAPTFAGNLVHPRRTGTVTPSRSFALAGRSYKDASTTIRSIWEVRHGSR